MSQNLHAYQKGFTLIEMLIATAIIGILLSSLTLFQFQNSQRVRESQDLDEARCTARSILDLLRNDRNVLGEIPSPEKDGRSTVELSRAALPGDIIPSSMSASVTISRIADEKLELVTVTVFWPTLKNAVRSVGLSSFIDCLPSAGH